MSLYHFECQQLEKKYPLYKFNFYKLCIECPTIRILETLANKIRLDVIPHGKYNWFVWKFIINTTPIIRSFIFQQQLFDKNILQLIKQYITHHQQDKFKISNVCLKSDLKSDSDTQIYIQGRMPMPRGIIPDNIYDEIETFLTDFDVGWNLFGDEFTIQPTTMNNMIAVEYPAPPRQQCCIYFDQNSTFNKITFQPINDRCDIYFDAERYKNDINISCGSFTVNRQHECLPYIKVDVWLLTYGDMSLLEQDLVYKYMTIGHYYDGKMNPIYTMYVVAYNPHNITIPEKVTSKTNSKCIDDALKLECKHVHTNHGKIASIHKNIITIDVYSFFTLKLEMQNIISQYEFIIGGSQILPMLELLSDFW